ncbi:MAG: DegV family protein [Oscillospiraceae bacterium]|jgi:DegV family protein with EDD domain
MAILITDSTSDLPLAELDAQNITMLSLKVSFGQEEFLDKRTITNEAFYEKLAQSETLPQTTLLSIGAFQEVFDRFPDDDIVVLPISAKLSGTFQSALAAKELTGRDNIYVVETGTVSIGLGLLVQRAAQLNEAGMPASEIASHISEIADRVRMFAMVDTLKYLVKGGRLSGMQGFLGEMLQIKPVISILHGEVLNVAKARGTKGAIQALLKLTEQGAPIDTSLPLCFGHTGNMALLAQLRDHFPHLSSAPAYSLGSVVGAHAGPGTTGIAYFTTK